MPVTRVPGALAAVDAVSPVGQAEQQEDGRWKFATARAEVSVVPLQTGRWRVSTRSLVGNPVPRATCETNFPLEVVQRLLRTTSPEWICDVLARHEDPAYVQGEMHSQLLAYFPHEAYAGKRLLDFGCGNGASTMAMAALLPHTEVIGIELNGDRLDEAAVILEYRRGLDNVRFLSSPSGKSLPAGIGWPAMVGAGCLAGIGFTMSLFIAALALTGELLDAAKIGILAGSAASALFGMGLLLLFLPRHAEK